MIRLDPIVRRKALDLGAPGRRWLAELPDLVADLERRWSVTAGEPYAGGSAAYTVRARTSDGTAAALKLAVPDVGFADVVHVLRAARGHGYVRLLAADPARHAVLLEALGPALHGQGLAPEAQLAVLAGMLRAAWTVPPAPGSAVAAKARDLAASITGMWERLDRPCPERVVDRALLFARRREAGTDPDRTVVVHGDPHPGNALRVPAPRAGADAGFVFVDPDGFRADPAYDLGVVLRDWCPQVLAAPGVARDYCRLLADRTGIDATAIWEWGFLERVSTGLYLADLGAGRLARPFLATAELLA